jgi:hypothetical protein
VQTGELVKTFGKYLAEIGAVTREQLEEATDSLVIVGGRLGTNLLDLGHLSIDDLDGHLADHHGMPTPPPRWVSRPAPEALELVTSSLAERHRVIPLAVEKGVLHLAMATPSHPDAIDEISFATSYRIEPYVLSEVRIALLLERHLNVPLEGRFADFSDWARRRHKHNGTSRAPAAPGASREAEEARRQREVYGVTPLEQGEELTDERALSSLESDWLTRVPGADIGAPSSSPQLQDPEAPERKPVALSAAEVFRLEQAIATARDREEVARLALRLARANAAASALFVVHNDTIRGAAGLGGHIAESIEGILLSLRTPSILSETALRGAPFRGALPKQPIDAQIFRLLGRETVREAMVVPVFLGERVVNLLYADNAELPLGTTSAAAMLALPALMTTAYARIVRVRRRHHC